MLTNDQIASTVMRGAVKCARRYMNWTGGYTVLEHGVEGAISYSVADSLFTEIRRREEESGFVALELSFEELKNFSLKKARRGRRRREFIGRPRIDVAAFNPAGKAIAVVEVKRWITFASSKTDIRRISSILRELSKKRGSIKLGCLVGLRWRSKRQRKPIKTFVSEFSSKVEAEFPLLRCQGTSKGFKVPRKYSDDPDFSKTAGYYAVCFRIRLRAGHH